MEDGLAVLGAPSRALVVVVLVLIVVVDQDMDDEARPVVRHIKRQRLHS